MERVWIAFGLTLCAGIATGIGSVIAFAAKRTDYRFLSVVTGFSAGVMLYVSFVDILAKGAAVLASRYGDYWGQWINAASFFGGMILIGLIDDLIPEAENPHKTHSEAETAPLHDRSARTPDFEKQAIEISGKPVPGVHDHGVHRRKLMRMGLFTAMAITIHNIPEGLAAFFAALQDPAIGLAIAFAIALHNIPEGISVSVPIFYATGNRKKAFAYSLLSGLAEPVGALIGFGALTLFMGGIPAQVSGILLGGVAGIMVFISLDELLPTSRAYGKGKDSLIGLVAGMAVMALSLLLMR